MDIWEKMSMEQGWNVSSKVSFIPQIPEIQEIKNENQNDLDNSKESIDSLESLQSTESMKIVKDNQKNSVNHNSCDMIVCGVKTLTIHGTKVHQIELECYGCKTSCIMTAVHDCEQDQDLQYPQGLENEQNSIEWVQ